MYQVHLKEFKLKKKVYTICYNNKLCLLEQIFNTIITLKSNIFSFDIIDNQNNYKKHFEVELTLDFINEIVLDLETGDNESSKRYDIELIICDYDLLGSVIIISKDNENLYFKPFYNDLKLNKIILLDFNLDFKISLENQTKDIPFEVSKEVKGKKLRFCLHNFRLNNIMTIHDMEEEDFKFDIEFCSKKDLKELYVNLKKEIDDIKTIINKNGLKDLKTIISNKKFNNALFSYKEDINIYKIYNEKFEEQHFLAFINYCYKYLFSFIIDIIGKIGGIINNNYEMINKNKNFITDIINEILQKLEYFNEYILYINNENNNVKNLILHKNNLNFKEKAEVLSCILSIILDSPCFQTNKKIEFFDFVAYNNKNVYLDAKNFLCEIIDNLNSNSILNKGYQKTLSRIKLDLNITNSNLYSKKDNRKVFILELVNLNQLKTNLKSYFNNLIVRYVDTKSCSSAQYDIFSGFVLINESIYNRIKNNYLENNDNKIFDENEKYVKYKINSIDKDYTEEIKKYNLYVYRAFWRFNH